MESLVNQTLYDIEIILVDDKSPDGSAALCDEWAKKDDRVKVIHKEVNEGQGLARNTGLETAKGEYVTMPDSDDYIDLNMLEKLYDYAVKDRLDAVYCEFNTDEYPEFHAMAYPNGIYKGRDTLDRVMLDMIGAEPEYQSDVKFQVSAAKVLYKLDTIRQNNLKFVSERQIISEDLIWNLDFLHVATSIRTTSERMYHYCYNDASTSHTYRPDRYRRLCELANHLEKYGERFEDKNEFALRLNRTRLFYLRDHVLALARNNNINLIKESVNNDSILALLRGYPIYRMPFRYRLIYHTLKYKHFSFLQFFAIGRKISKRRRLLTWGGGYNNE